ncbi:MAG TPA: hypothetical protein PLO61_00695 [Fimbriimonadaceae bacterium]|nr:hypothetical protein [Fimbriimonadaceae bacterium]HRJ32416.1 hypothetical protein [Fimbriimonadaceae bacterium]
MAKLDLELIRHALETARNHGLRQIRVAQDDDEFEAILGEPVEAQTDFVDPGTTSEVSTPQGPIEGVVRAPVVGYLRRLEGSPEPGGRIEAGKPVATIAALGLQNDLVSSVSGEWLEWLVEWDAPVEYGQPIGRIRESA